MGTVYRVYSRINAVVWAELCVSHNGEFMLRLIVLWIQHVIRDLQDREQLRIATNIVEFINVEFTFAFDSEFLSFWDKPAAYKTCNGNRALYYCPCVGVDNENRIVFRQFIEAPNSS